MQAKVLGFIKRVTILALTSFIVACATTPTPLDQAKTVPDERVYVYNPKLDEKVRAVFVRDEGFVGSAVQMHLYVNGNKVASFDPGERLDLYLSSGEYIFGVIPTDPFGGHTIYSITQNLESEKTYYYRLLFEDPPQHRIQRYIPKQVLENME